MTTDEFLSLLTGVKKHGNSYVARCPAHPDKRPSLSVKEGSDGRTVAHCFAGCTFEQICDALHIQQKELAGELDDVVSSNEPEAVYTYHDETGTPLFEVVRLPGKRFLQRLPGAEKWGIGDVRRVPYNLPAVIRAAEHGEMVVCVEGEKDVEALRKQGVVATCNPGGAGKWDPEWGEYLRGALVVIIRDKDDPGSKHAEDVHRSVVGRAKEVYMKQARKGKDVSDHLAAGFTLKQLVPWKDKRMSGITSAGELADEALESLEIQPNEFPVFTNPWGFEEPEFAPGRLYICGAWTGHGKSALAIQLSRFLASQTVRVGFITNEMSKKDVRNRLLCHQGFKLKELERPWEMSLHDKVRMPGVAEEIRGWNYDIIFDPEVDYQKVSQYQDEGGYDFVFLDHLHRTARTAQGEEAAIQEEIRGLTNVALNYDIPVFVVAQFRRPPLGVTMPRPTIHDFKGSSAIEQEAAMALAVWRNGEDAELLVLKNRHGRSGQTERLRYWGERFSFEAAA